MGVTSTCPLDKTIPMNIMARAGGGLIRPDQRAGSLNFYQ